MICPKGIIVFESKNYSGWIFGSENQKSWCQTLPTGKGRSNKEYFYNPIMQNQTHIRRLSEFLGDKVPIYSVVVFSDRCTLKNIQLDCQDVSVIYQSELQQTISKIFCQSSDTLSENRINEIYNKLYPYSQVSSETKAKHIDSVKNYQSANSDDDRKFKNVSEYGPPLTSNFEPVAHHTISEPQESKENPKYGPVETPMPPRCPRCNGVLVLRTAKKGSYTGNQFYGCSNYPQCKYLQNLK
jgi:hypothetical protein